MREQSLARLPQLAAGFEQIEGALDVGAQERARPGDRAVDVAFGREVNHHLRLVLGQCLAHGLEIDQVDMREGVVGAALQPGQAARIGRVG